MLVAVVILVLSNVLVVAVVVAAARGRLAPNALAGLRIPSVMESAATWQAGHRAALPAVVVGCALATVASVLPLVTGWTDGEAAASILIACGALLAGTAVGGVAAHRAAGRVERDAEVAGR